MSEIWQSGEIGMHSRHFGGEATCSSAAKSSAIAGGTETSLLPCSTAKGGSSALTRMQQEVG